MYQDITNFNEAMKIFYASKLTEYRRFYTWFYDAKDIQVGTEFFNGKYYHIPLDIRTGVSVGSRPEASNGGSLPEYIPHTPTHVEAYSRYHYVTVSVTGPVEAQGSGSQEGIWESVTEKEMRKAGKTFAEQMSRSMWNSGYGVLCEIASVAATATANQYTITIKKKYVPGTTFTNPSGTAPSNIKYIRGLTSPRRLVYGKSSGGVEFAGVTPTGRGVCTVVSVSTSTPFDTFVVDISANPGALPLADDIFVLGDAVSYGKHSYNQEMNGLADIISDSTDFGAVQIATYPEWKAFIADASGGTGAMTTPSEDLMQQTYDNITLLSGVEKVDCLAMTPATWRTLVQVIRNKGGERFVPCEFKGGVDRLAWDFSGGPCPLVPDFYAPNNEIQYIAEEALMKCETKAFEWDERGGGVWKWQNGADAYIGFAKMYGNLTTDRRNGLGKITNVLESLATLA